MEFNPRDREEVFENIASTIAASSDSMTNFSEGSFNAQFLNAYADELRELELQMLAAFLAGSADYAGKSLTRGDLDTLGIDNVSPGDINRFMEDEHLDLLAANVGVTRNEGERARTTVEFTVASGDVSIPHGFQVSTGADPSDDEQLFFVNATGDIVSSGGGLLLSQSGEADPEQNDDGEWIVSVEAVAAETGPRYNVPDNTLTHMPGAQPGILSVTNPVPASGGDPEQSTESLRTDVQNALLESSVGGTRPGLRGALRREFSEELGAVDLIEYLQQQPPYVDVLAVGAQPDALVSEIAQYKPLGIRHNMIRPATISVATSADIIGDVSPALVRDEIDRSLRETSIGESLYWSALITSISSVVVDVESVSTLNTAVDSVGLEHHIYDTSNTTPAEVELEHAPFGLIRDEQHLVTPSRITDGFSLMYPVATNPSPQITIRGIVNGTSRELTEGTEYTVSGNTITVADGIQIDENSILSVDYTAAPSAYQISAVYRAPKFVDGEDEMRGTELVQGSDYTLIDSSEHGTPTAIDISQSESMFTNRDRVVIDYEPALSEARDVMLTEGEILRGDETSVTVVTGEREDTLV